MSTEFDLHLAGVGQDGRHLYTCPEDPDRIRRPMVKTADGQWREVGWDEALRRCTELLAPRIAGP
jgi:anaerobic selenocysteine-containing dehydrogenase